MTGDEITVVVLGLIVLLDLIGAVVIAVVVGRVPVVMGDVAKVGAGALATAVAMGRKQERG